MKIAFWILGILAALFGVTVLANAKSALHEIEAGIGFVLMGIFWSGAGVMSRIDRMADAVAVKNSPAPSTPRRAPEDEDLRSGA